MKRFWNGNSITAAAEKELDWLPGATAGWRWSCSLGFSFSDILKQEDSELTSQHSWEETRWSGRQNFYYRVTSPLSPAHSHIPSHFLTPRYLQQLHLIWPLSMHATFQGTTSVFFRQRNSGLSSIPPPPPPPPRRPGGRSRGSNLSLQISADPSGQVPAGQLDRGAVEGWRPQGHSGSASSSSWQRGAEEEIYCCLLLSV